MSPTLIYRIEDAYVEACAEVMFSSKNPETMLLEVTVAAESDLRGRSVTRSVNL